MLLHKNFYAFHRRGKFNTAARERRMRKHLVLLIKKKNPRKTTLALSFI